MATLSQEEARRATFSVLRKKKKKTQKQVLMNISHFVEFGQTPGAGDGQGSLAGCSSGGCKESETTWQLNNNSNIFIC